MKFLTPEEFSNLPEDQQKDLLAKMKSIQDQQKVIDEEAKGLKQLSMEEFTSKIEDTVKKLIEPMTNVDRKYFAFPGIGKEGLDDKSAQGKFAKTIKFLSAMVNKDVRTVSAMSEEVRVKANLSEGTATAGGFLVPEEFKAEVLRLAPTYGKIRANCRVIPMKYDVVNIPAAGTTDQSAIWTNEAAAIKQTNPTFRQVTLTINKLAALPKVTNELLADANVDVVNYLAELIAEAFAKEEDNQGFNGSGSPFVGVLQATGAPTSPHAGGTAYQSLSYQDLVNATGDLYDTALANAKFYFHRSIVAHIRGLITTAGAPIFGGTANSIVGYPLVGCEMLPAAANVAAGATAYGVFGDIRKGVAMGERGTIQMAISTEATVDSDNLFEKDMAALRMVERVALGVLLPSAFTKIVTAA